MPPLTGLRGTVNGVRLVWARARDIVTSLVAGIVYLIFPIPLELDLRASDFEIERAESDREPDSRPGPGSRRAVGDQEST